ncbi:hypothetical protein MMC06_000026 [Schaereria dolodes]|nr:hypothetical protein [Schaereria dolodes]
MDVAGKIQGAETAIGYRFKDPQILWEALQAAGSSVRRAGEREIRDGNKRLALLGDTILKLVLVEDWYNSQRARVDADQAIQNIGSNANLDRVGREHGLSTLINTNPSQGSFVSPVTMSATVEAILGAVYLDDGMETVKQVMQTLGLGPT